MEKATELGVARITPILARRTEKHLSLAAAKRTERWRRMALASASQSRPRRDLPESSTPPRSPPHSPASPHPSASSSARPNRPSPSPLLLVNLRPSGAGKKDCHSDPDPGTT